MVLWHFATQRVVPLLLAKVGIPILRSDWVILNQLRGIRFPFRNGHLWKRLVRICLVWTLELSLPPLYYILHVTIPDLP